MNHLSLDEVCELIDLNQDKLKILKIFITLISNNVRFSYCNEFVEFETNQPDQIIKIFKHKFSDIIDVIENHKEINKNLSLNPKNKKEPVNVKKISIQSKDLPKCIYNQTDPNCIKEL